MQRSAINAALLRATETLERWHWSLPAWGSWTAADFAAHPEASAYLRAHQLGWDVTDFGSNRFAECGLVLFCLRNGIVDIWGERTYAEKLLFVGEGQVTPTHRHAAKMEDIINRAGGDLVIEFAATDADGNVLTEDVTVPVDGLPHRLAAWDPLVLQPGQSVTIRTGLYHRFYGRKGGGPVLVGEVSQVNDDNSDNFFLEPIGRFAAIEEDEPALRPLWNEGVS
ncbi:D-lyxose/D-mannose family sugar isomerase [Rhizobium leguminosarum]|uniref:D-lyxose/D-mannose family sugar isomerase n=1 Tax=Rhizobium leguminosarum TaxID=384 RepID=UPI00103181C9|nr:D-lyxose/D-mannose family sugar isomerase [Rhizobium leguminosarum]TAU87328.1 D-lyxose/D-mannose family sugar isomerase [Rhizobium leguminosarum]TAV51862.1 D-lyxose/D-mannose family sugar isomerase [Rhizobium leguminosarum]TAX33050.1 D-lyxose/D-mannose family sugar isomerase [Rhizobium leguminosarum]TAX54014.1 D-lyxose/D-mannose family sugar isomerase [Rhizobium leguminosarum]TAX99904.1 D-lyxose/D-mannose family sugar isomerase [Rhizobium leguminosarum]